MNRLAKRIIVIAALMLLALFSMVTVSLPSGSTSAVRQPAASPLFQQVPQCPPLTTINGTLGSGSPDYPATSGQQTGRILNGLGNTACGDSNPCSLNTATGSRAFDAYTFINTGSATACVTVNFTLDGCSSNASLQYSARLGSFDPANPCANYVGDAGAGFGGPDNNGSFSFNVPAGQTFVVVVNDTNIGESVGCTYTLAISGLACQAAPCPPTTAINGTLGSGSPDFPATSAQQTGRIVNGLGNLACGSSNPCSLNTTTGSRAFDAYTFINTGSATACVTVNFTLDGCSSNASLQYSARLGSFDPANPCANYVGDAGAGFGGPDNNGSFSFNVPAGQTFVVVVNDTNIGESVGCTYTLTISGVSCVPAPCPPTDGIVGTLGTGSPDYPSTTGQQTGRLSQNGVASSCAVPKVCPNTVGTDPRTFDAYQFQNTSASTACVTVAFDTSCGANQAIRPVVYLGSFDPTNLCLNYLADLGQSINGNDAGSFSFNVPAGQIITLVIHEIGTTNGCSGYRFTVTGLTSCSPPQGCSGITCPSDIVATNAQGQCGATVNYTVPSADPACGAVTCLPPPGFFPVGTTTVNCSPATGADCSFTVTVTDTQPPTLTPCPSNTSSTTDGTCEVVNYAPPTATDNCGSATVNCDPPSGFCFPLGTTTVTCTASDDSPDSPNATCSFTVTVGACAVACPADIIVNNTPGQCSANVTFEATAPQDCGAVTCTPTSGSPFPVGATTVTCSTPAGGDCSFTVTVNDTQPPTLTPCPSDTSVATGGACQVVNYTPPTATDNCGSANVNCDPPSGFCFPVGTTTVTCTASDDSPNSPNATCSFTVTVGACAITCPADIMVNNTPGQCGAAVTFGPSAPPACGTVPCTPASGSVFPVGATTVLCSTTVGPSCSFTVKVNDIQTPSIICPANITSTAAASCPPGTSSGPVNFTVTASDNCPGVTIACKNQNNQVVTSGQTFPVGTTTVTCTATDASGNFATCSFTVTVFSGCLQDDSDPSIVVLFNSQTGEYRFCCGGTVFTGTGTATVKGCVVTIQHNAPDRRVRISLEGSVNRGSASLQSLPGTTTCTITDRDTRDNDCVCQ